MPAPYLSLLFNDQSITYSVTVPVSRSIIEGSGCGQCYMYLFWRGEQGVMSLFQEEAERINTRAPSHFVSYVIDTRSEQWIGKPACMFFAGYTE